MQQTRPLTPFEIRAQRVKARLSGSGLVYRDVLRALDMDTPSGKTWMINVLGGKQVSNPLLDKIEGVLDDHERGRKAA